MQRPAVPTNRGLPRCHSGGGRGSGGYHPGEAVRHAAPAARRRLRAQHGLALPEPARHDAQKQRTPASRNGPTSPHDDEAGSTPRLISTPNTPSSSTKPAPRPRWPAYRGRAKRGQRCRSPIPHGHWKTTTFTGALRLEGMTALMVLGGPCAEKDRDPTHRVTHSGR